MLRQIDSIALSQTSPSGVSGHPFRSGTSGSTGPLVSLFPQLELLQQLLYLSSHLRQFSRRCLRLVGSARCIAGSLRDPGNVRGNLARSLGRIADVPLHLIGRCRLFFHCRRNGG